MHNITFPVGSERMFWGTITLLNGTMVTFNGIREGDQMALHDFMCPTDDSPIIVGEFEMVEDETGNMIWKQTNNCISLRPNAIAAVKSWMYGDED